MPARKVKDTQHTVTIDDSPNRLSMFYRPERCRENVVENGERRWVCPTCGNKVVTYTALTAVPECTGSDRKHQSRKMDEKSKKT